MPFSDIPIRSNGPPNINASWFNTIRTYLIDTFGDIAGEESQSIGQGETDQDVGALAEIDGSGFTKIDVEYLARRVTTGDGSVAMMQSGFFTMHKLSGTWALHGHEQNIFGDAEVTFSLFQSGDNLTLRYTTSTITGSSHTGTLAVRSTKWVS